MSRRRLSLIEGGQPNVYLLSNEELLREWQRLNEQERRLAEEAAEKETAFKQAAQAYDEAVMRLNDIASLLRSFSRELERRGLL